MRLTALFSLTRLYVACLVLCAGTWIWATIALHLHRKESATFHETMFAREIQEARENSESVRERDDGELTPLPKLRTIDQATTDEWFRRQKRDLELQGYQMNAVFAAIVVSGLLQIVLLVRFVIHRRRWESADRPALSVVSERFLSLMQSGGTFVAQSGTAHKSKRVEFDAGRAVIVFRNFSLVNSFARNPVREQFELAFPELLVVTMMPGPHGSRSLSVRTTQGRITISDAVRPFDELSELLHNLAELNRSSPADFQSALAREPVIQTPAWAWFLFAAICAGFVALFWWALS